MLDHIWPPPNLERDIEAISSAFRSARSQGACLQRFPGNFPSTLEQAYAIQNLSTKSWPDALVGWKVGAVTGGFREHFGVERLAGPIFARNLRHARDGETIGMRVFAGGFAAVEAEFVVCVGDIDLLTDAQNPFKDLTRAIRSVHIGIEIASSPLPTINALGPVAVISDFGNNAGLVVGPAIEDWNDHLLSESEVSVTIDGRRVGQARTASGPSGPLGSVAFIIDHCRRHGYALAPGTFITTGAVSGVHDAAIGSHSVINFEGLGRLEIDLVAFEPSI